MRTLNLGILAHVDAGKTSLTERLLYEAGVLDTIGSVDAGSTQTDTLALERRRGITIRTAVATFVREGVTVNLVDTPGHPDFIAEVERVLDVLDGVVLVVSAVEGVQSQTRVLMRALQRLRLPVIVFVNKIDRSGARYHDLVTELNERLGGGMIAVQRVCRLGGRSADVRGDLDDSVLAATALDVLTATDDRLLEEFVATGAVAPQRLRAAVAEQTAKALVRPVFFGSAVTGAGAAELMTGILAFLPASAPAGADDADLDHSPVSATVFKIDRGDAGERICFLRMRAGTLRTRDLVELPDGRGGRVTGIRAGEPGGFRRRDVLLAGQIGTVTGLPARIGDVIGAADHRRVTWHFSPPTLESVVVPVAGTDRGALHTALSELAEADPLIGLRSDDDGQLVVSLYGEVQKEVLESTLLEEHGLEVRFRASTTLCIERLTGTGCAVEHLYAGDNPFLATVGLRVEPAPVGAGVDFRLGIELGSMPLAFLTAVQDTVRQTLRQGLFGWDVPDCVVTMTHGRYAPRQSAMHANFDKSMSSTGADFRGLTPLVVMAALQRAGTAVHEPFHRFQLEIPAATYGVVLPALASLGGIPEPPIPDRSAYRLGGVLPAASVHVLYQTLPGLTSGEAVLETAFDSYRPVVGRPPVRARSGPDPLRRKAYLTAVLRRLL
jgi:ribosomal protection tetracycline resistance protein